MALVSSQNFRAVDRLLLNPTPIATAHIKALGPGAARSLLRYQASEQDRWYMETWETVQLVFGAVFFFYLLFGSTEGKFPLFIVLAMLVAVAAQRLLLSPAAASLGRVVDFQPEGVPSPDKTRLWVASGAYTVVELAKWALGLVLAVSLVWRRSRSERARHDLDVIDKANHRHVNR